MRDELWNQYMQTRDPGVREEIILQNIPLVRHVLKRLAIPTLTDDTYHDLMSQGILGLIDAVDRFEPRRGWRFSTYATLRIRGHIIDSLRAMDMLPRSARKRVKNIERALARLRAELGREPHDEEVATETHLDLKAYRAALVEANCTVLSLDEPFEISDAGETGCLRDLIQDDNATPPENALEEQELRERLTVAVQQLPERLQVLLSLYYYEELTMKEIGQVLDLSESRVSQLHARAMRRLQAALEHEPALTATHAPTARPALVPVFATG